MRERHVEKGDTSFRVSAEGLCNVLRHVRLNRFVDIGCYLNRLCIVNLDSKGYTGIVRYNLPVHSLSHDEDVFLNVDHNLLLKTLERFGSQEVQVTTICEQSHLVVSQAGKRYRIPFTASGHSRMLIELEPVKGQEKDFHARLPVAILKDLCKNLQAVDSRARISFIQAGNLVVRIESASSVAQAYDEQVSVPLDGMADLYLRESTVSTVLILTGEIGVLLKLMDNHVSVALYEEYLIISDQRCEIVLPRVPQSC